MIPIHTYLYNLSLCSKFSHINGSIVECGVWRGGMIAGISAVVGKEKKYMLFDSFEGLPEAQEIDGQSAIDWQNNKESKAYLDNCKAEITFAQTCMQNAGVKNVKFVQGWFNETLPVAKFDEPIAILRLDADWYSSTMDCLTNLYDKVVPGGVIILDDYYVWDGCSKAVHDYIVEEKLDVKIKQYNDSDICYIIKN